MKGAGNDKLLDLWGLTFHNPATPVLEGVITIHNYVIMYLILAIVVIIWFLLRGCFLLYESKKVGLAPVRYDPLLETVWTVAPVFIIVAIAMPSFSLLYSIDEVVDSFVTVKLIGHRWYWSYELSETSTKGFEGSVEKGYTGAKEMLKNGLGGWDFLFSKTKLHFKYFGKFVTINGATEKALIYKVTRSIVGYSKRPGFDALVKVHKEDIAKHQEIHNDFSGFLVNCKKYLIKPTEVIFYKKTTDYYRLTVFSKSMLDDVRPLCKKHGALPQVVLGNIILSQYYLSQFIKGDVVTPLNVPGPLGNSQQGNDMWVQVQTPKGITYVLVEMKSSSKGLLLKTQIDGLQGPVQQVIEKEFLNHLKASNIENLFVVGKKGLVKRNGDLEWILHQPLIKSEIINLMVSGVELEDATKAVLERWVVVRTHCIGGMLVSHEFNAVVSSNSEDINQLVEQLFGPKKLVGVSTKDVIKYE